MGELVRLTDPDERFMAMYDARQRRLARERCRQGHRWSRLRRSAHLGVWIVCEQCGLIDA